MRINSQGTEPDLDSHWTLVSLILKRNKSVGRKSAFLQDSNRSGERTCQCLVILPKYQTHFRAYQKDILACLSI